MARLADSFSFVIRPKPPYDFKLTVKKPAGWSLFTPFEIYAGTLWTATYLDGTFAGIRLGSSGTVNRPVVNARIFVKGKVTRQKHAEMERLLARTIGADQDLSGFYSMARKDKILKHTIDDLYGMHDTFSSTIFSDAVLAILLQMAPLRRSNEMTSSFITNYGELAEFDERKIRAWPVPKRVCTITAQQLAKRCKVGYRAKSIVRLAKKMAYGDFPSAEELEEMTAEESKEKLMELPEIGDYSSDIINPHGGFPIDVWSVEIFGKLLFGREPKNNRDAIERVKAAGMKRWGTFSWMAFFYVVQDLGRLSKKLGVSLRLS